MLDWLKSILGEAYNEEIDGKVAAEIGRGFVARSDFNEVNAAKKKLEDDVKARDKQLSELSASQEATQAMKEQIAALQAQNKADKDRYDAELARVRMDNAVEKALSGAGARNVTAAKALLADFLSDAKLAEDGTVKGLAAEIDTLARGEDTAFLFEADKTPNQPNAFTGLQPGQAGGNTPPPGMDSWENRLAEARKTGNTAGAVAIKREAAANGVILI